MHAYKHPLEVLQIKTPCTADWSAMQGDDRTRFCTHCQKHVHRLSAMSRSDAEKLICESAGNLCAIIEQTADGTVQTLDYAAPRPRRRIRWKPLLLLSTAVSTSLAMMGISHAPVPAVVATTGKIAVPARMLMGEIAPLPPTKVPAKAPQHSKATHK